MDISNQDLNTVRLNITVPKWLVRELESAVPKRGKSGFISKAIEESIARGKRDIALKKLEALPPTFKNIGSGKEFIGKTREKEDRIRNNRLGI